GPAPALAANGRFEPAVKPRALAILPSDDKVYVAGQTADAVFVVDARTRRVRGSIAVAAAPVGVVAAPDGSAVYAVSHEGAVVTASVVGDSYARAGARFSVDRVPHGVDARRHRRRRGAASLVPPARQSAPRRRRLHRRGLGAARARLFARRQDGSDGRRTER